MGIKKGFTILEVLLSMFILISCIYVLTNLQIRSIFRVLGDRDTIDRVFLVKKALYSTLYGSGKLRKPLKEIVENPKTSIKTECDTINKKSEAANLPENIRFLKAKGRWESNAKKREITMLSFVSLPDKEREKK